VLLFPSDHSFSSSDKPETWIHRVLDNLHQALHGATVKPSARNGAPLHFESIDLSARTGRAQTFSAGVHAVILAALLLAIAAAPNHVTFRGATRLSPIKKLLPYVRTLTQSAGEASLGSNGGGGENDPRPARFGELAPKSSMPLAPPRLNRNKENELPVPPAVFDPNAPTSVTLMAKLGLPWMDSDTDSAGPGKRHGFGAGDGGTMGDENGLGAGDGEADRPYANVVAPVTCLYCPEPGYTDEARRAKVEGKILLQVLVGPDGKAQRIEILRGLDAGLEERAKEAIRSWRFSPGRDAARRPVASWVTIETRFQLF
jgi:protein TonB